MATAEKPPSAIPPEVMGEKHRRMRFFFDHYTSGERPRRGRIGFDPLKELETRPILMDLSRDIHSLTEFKKNTPEFLKQLKETGVPIVLTINGKTELVVQDAASYQKLLDLAEEARVVEGIRLGLEDVKAGRTISLEDFKEHVRKKHGISV